MLLVVGIRTKADRMPTRKITSLKCTLLYLAIVISCQSSDIETNPGPRQPKCPCGDCGKAVTWSRMGKSIACDECSSWFHTDCIGLHTCVFDVLANSHAEWLCSKCGMPNFATSLFDSQSEFHLDSISNCSASSNESFPI